MGNTCGGVNDISYAATTGYYSPDSGELVETNVQSVVLADPTHITHITHDPQEELDAVTRVDIHAFFAADTCYLISAVWMAAWLSFVKGEQPPPGPVNNLFLVTLSAARPPLPKLDFKLISPAVWEFIFRRYGGGPVIFVRVPGGFDDGLYRNSKWTRHVDFRSIIRVVRWKYSSPSFFICLMFTFY